MEGNIRDNYDNDNCCGGTYFFRYFCIGLHAVCTRLRVPHTGQRFSDAQAGHQDVEKRPGSTSARVQDVQSHQKSHTPRAQGPVRRQKRMRCVVIMKRTYLLYIIYTHIYYKDARPRREHSCALGTTGQ